MSDPDDSLLAVSGRRTDGGFRFVNYAHPDLETVHESPFNSEAPDTPLSVFFSGCNSFFEVCHATRDGTLLALCVRTDGHTHRPDTGKPIVTSTPPEKSLGHCVVFLDSETRQPLRYSMHNDSGYLWRLKELVGPCRSGLGSRADVVSCAGKYFYLWNAADGSCVQRLGPDKNSLYFIVEADWVGGGGIICGCGDGSRLHGYDLVTGKLAFGPLWAHTSSTVCGDRMPEKKLVLTGQQGDKAQVTLWDLSLATLGEQHDHMQTLHPAGAIQLLNDPTGRLDLYVSAVKAVGDKHLVIVRRTKANHDTTAIWDIRKPTSGPVEVMTLTTEPNRTSYGTITRLTEDLFASATGDLIVWSLRSRKALRTRHGLGASGCCAMVPFGSDEWAHGGQLRKDEEERISFCLSTKVVFGTAIRLQGSMPQSLVASAALLMLV